MNNSYSVLEEFRDSYWGFEEGSNRADETDKLISVGNMNMLLMQAGEKKLKEFL
jgi:hypothetical protein